MRTSALFAHWALQGALPLCRPRISAHADV